MYNSTIACLWHLNSVNFINVSTPLLNLKLFFKPYSASHCTLHRKDSGVWVLHQQKGWVGSPTRPWLRPGGPPLTQIACLPYCVLLCTLIMVGRPVQYGNGGLCVRKFDRKTFKMRITVRKSPTMATLQTSSECIPCTQYCMYIHVCIYTTV